MPTISAMDVVNHDMYATKKIQSYDYTFKNVVADIYPGQLIGNVYSWVVNPLDKNVYWMFYPTIQDMNNFTNAFYVPHDESALSLPDMPGILQHIADMADVQAKLTELDAIQKAGGTIPYYIEKYGKIALITAGVIYVGLPALKSISNKSSVGATKKSSSLLLLLLIGGGVLMAAKKPKLKGSVIVDPLDKGSFVNDNVTNYIEPIPINVIPITQVMTPPPPQSVQILQPSFTL